MNFEEKLKYYLSDNKASISFVNISDIYVSDDNTVLKILCSLKNENLNVNLLYIIKGELQYFLSDFNCDVHIGLNNMCYDEINIIAQVDKDRKIKRMNRNKCSWEGYRKLYEGFEN